MSTDPPADDPLTDQASTDAQTAKDLKKKQKMLARQEEMRRKAKEEARMKAAARKTKDVVKTEDEEQDDVTLTAEQIAWIDQLKLLPQQGRQVDSFAFPDGLTRRLTPLEYAMYLGEIMHTPAEEKASVIERFNNKDYPKRKLQELQAVAMDAAKKKAFKGKSGASLEARIAKMESKARRLFKNITNQFIVLKRSGSAVLANLQDAVEYVRVGMFDLDRGDDNNRETFLHIACREGEWAVAQWLLAHGADPNALNDRGETPTMLAMRTLVEGDERAAGAYDCLWGLLERGGDLTIKSVDGKSPLDLAMAMEPPLELVAVVNLILLRVRDQGDWNRHTLWWHEYGETWEGVGTVPIGQIIKIGLKDYRLRKMREEKERQEEEERKRQEEEEARRKAEEEAERERKEAAALRKNGRILWASACEMMRGCMANTAKENPDWLAGIDLSTADLTIDESFDDISNTYAFVRLICDPNVTRIFHGGYVDVSAPLPFLPGMTAMALACACRQDLMVGALLGCGADPNGPVSGQDGTLAVGPEANAADLSGDKTTPLAVAARALDGVVAGGAALEAEPTRKLMEVCSRLVEAGAQTRVTMGGSDAEEEKVETKVRGKKAVKRPYTLPSKADGVAHAGSILSEESVRAWLQQQLEAADPSLYNESKQRRVLAAMLVLVEAYEEQDRKNMENAQTRLREKKRRARELAKRQEELTQKLLQSSMAAQEQVNEDLEALTRQLEEQQERARQEALEAEALLQAKLARGKKDHDADMYEKAMKLAAMQFAQTESEEAAAAAALAEKLKKKGKKSKDEKAEAERLKAEGEELARQQATEKEELMEDLEPPGMMDNALYTAFTMMDLGLPPASDADVAALKPELTRTTVAAMERMMWTYKFYRESHKGLDAHILATLSERGYEHKTGEGAWVGAQALDEMLNASIAERKILRKFLTQGSSFSKKATREINRRLGVLDVNAQIYEDLLRRVFILWPEQLTAEAPAKELRQLQEKVDDIGKRREEEEMAMMLPVFSPPINTVRKGALSKELAGIAAPLVASIETAFQSVHPDDQDALPLDVNIVARLLSEQSEWEVEGYLQRQLANTDALVRGLRADKAKCQEQMRADPDMPAAARAEMDEMVQRLNDQMAPLDAQHDMYMQLLGALADHQKKLYAKLPMEDQAVWNKCWARHQDQVKASIAQQEADRTTEQRRTAGPSKAELLLEKVKKAHEQDWLAKPTYAGREIVTSGGRVEALLDEDLDGNWMKARLGDLTGIDKDIIEDLLVLTEPQAVRYLAIKMADNEAHAAFLRKCHKLAGEQLDDEEKEKVKDYQHFLDRRFPMFQHLYNVVVGYLEDVDHGLPKTFTPFDGVTPVPKHDFKHKDEALVDLAQERETTGDIYLGVCIHEATTQPLDWSGLREDMAAEQWMCVLSRVCNGIMGGKTSGYSGGIAGRVYDDVGTTIVDRQRDAAERLKVGMLCELHKQLHSMCDVSEDTVEMVVNTTGQGRVDKSNLVRVLHALHVACHRDSSVFWDTQAMMPHATYGAAGNHSHWGLFHTAQSGVLTPEQGRLVFAFNDFDVRGGEFYGKFLQMLSQRVSKALKSAALEFPMEVFGAGTLKRFNGAGLTEEKTSVDLPRAGVPMRLPQKYGSGKKDDDEEEMEEAEDSTMSVMPIDGYGSLRDNYLDYNTYNTNVPRGVERQLRAPVPFFELRGHLVTQPDLDRYMPMNWKY